MSILEIIFLFWAVIATLAALFYFLASRGLATYIRDRQLAEQRQSRLYRIGLAVGALAGLVVIIHRNKIE